MSLILSLFLSAYVLVYLSEEMGFKYIPTLNEVKIFLGIEKPSNLESDFSVHFIDVGQGDSTLIISDGKTVLIDAGEKEMGTRVVKYLENLGIEKLDYVIATHPHSDHIGGLSQVIDKFSIGKIIMPKLRDEIVPTTKTYTALLSSIAEKGLKITPAKAGMSYELGRGRLEVLAPDNEFEDLNNYSVVARLIYDKSSFLFTGDIEQEAEKSLLNTGAGLKSNVLKIAHHGSSTSTHQAFLDAVNPQFCVIPVGDDNRYNHPNSNVIKRLTKMGVRIFRTDYDGDIVFEYENKKLVVKKKVG